MYCLHCGKEIGENAPVCPYCGRRNTAAGTKRDTVALLGFALSLGSVIPFASVFAPIGLILCTVSLIRGLLRHTLPVLAVIGIPLSALVILLTVLQYAGVIPLFFGLV